MLKFTFLFLLLTFTLSAAHAVHFSFDCFQEKKTLLQKSQECLDFMRSKNVLGKDVLSIYTPYKLREGVESMMSIQKGRAYPNSISTHKSHFDLYLATPRLHGKVHTFLRGLKKLSDQDKNAVFDKCFVAVNHINEQALAKKIVQVKFQDPKQRSAFAKQLQHYFKHTNYFHGSHDDQGDYLEWQLK